MRILSALFDAMIQRPSAVIGWTVGPSSRTIPGREYLSRLSKDVGEPDGPIWREEKTMTPEEIVREKMCKGCTCKTVGFRKWCPDVKRAVNAARFVQSETWKEALSMFQAAWKRALQQKVQLPMMMLEKEFENKAKEVKP